MSEPDVRLRDDATSHAKIPVAARVRGSWGVTVGSLTSRQVNLLLASALFVAVVTGLTSWAVGTVGAGCGQRSMPPAV